MKPIGKDEIYEHLTSFLRERGIEFKNGSYTKQIQKGCSLLGDSINLSQEGLERAKTEIDRKLDQMRQVIHERTAPKSRSTAPAAEAPPSKPAASTPKSTAKKSPARAKKKSRKPRA
ncbi:MAG: hypothetical protein JWR26_4775 [Pedosphaera sp.]|nr:hypothetical protein [Pedosphaera sp.]